MYTPVSWPAPDLLSRRAAAIPDRSALIDAESGRSWTYGELAAGPVAELAAGIRAAGLDPGDHLGVCLPPGLDVALLLHAAARAGVVFVPLPPDVPEGVLERRCAAADLDALTVIEGPAAVDPGFDGPVVTLGSLRNGAEPPTPHRWPRAAVQWLVFTSGTTGQPSAVQITGGNLVASATASALRLGVEPDDRWLACLPMHHVGGLAPLVRSSLYGTTAVVQAAFEGEATAAVIERHGITGVSLVPTMLTRLLDADWSPPEPLRFVLLGGAPASIDLIHRAEAADVPVCPTYGATETASQIATARPEEAFERPGTVGTPVLGTDIDVVDEGGNLVPRGSAGELVVSGPTVSPGYYGERDGSTGRLSGGTFHTRDRGYLDEDGYLWVEGRLDDAILTGGETVHPDAVADVLRAHSAVGDAAVVGVEDPEWGEVIAALVTPRSNQTVDAEGLRTHCREHLAPMAVPKLIEIVDALPRTASGTVDRPAVSERLREARRRGGL